jgi:hypothetical protein
MHYCQRCDYYFETNHNFKIHLKSKKHLKNLTLFLSNENPSQFYKCQKCDKEYKHHSSFYRHNKICINNIDTLKLQIIKKDYQHQLELYDHKLEIEKLKHKEENTVVLIKNDESSDINKNLVNLILHKENEISTLKNNVSQPLQLVNDINNSLVNDIDTLIVNNIDITPRLSDMNFNVSKLSLASNNNFQSDNKLWISLDKILDSEFSFSREVITTILKWITNQHIYQNSIVKMQNKKIKVLESLSVKKQKRQDYQSNVIYIVTTEENKKKRIYVIGKSQSLKDRLSTYNKTSEHEVVYYKQCKSIEDMDIIEKMVIKKLKDYKETANRDRFILPIDKDISFFSNVIEQSIKFF